MHMLPSSNVSVAINNVAFSGSCVRPHASGIAPCLRMHGLRTPRFAVVASASKPEKFPTSKSGLMKQRKAWLKGELEGRNLPADGNKAKLAERLSLALLSEQGEGLSAGSGPKLTSSTTKTALMRLKKAQLVFELSSRNLNTAGKKEVLAMRLLDALRSEASEAQAEAGAEIELELLRQRLLALDASVATLNEQVAGAKESKEDAENAVKEIMEQLAELQAEAEADQSEVEELQQLVEFFREGEEELIPMMERRKAKTLARLRELQAGIAVSEDQAVALRSKLRMVEQAKLFGAEELEVEVEVEEELELVSASTLSSSAASDPLFQASRPSATSPGRIAPGLASFGRSSPAPGDSTIVTAYGPNNGRGRTQTATTRSPVRIPATSAGGESASDDEPSIPAPAASVTPEPKDPVPSAPPTPVTPEPAATTSIPPASASALTPAAKSSGGGLSKRPEAVGIVIAFAVLTVVDGIRSALK